MYYIYDKQEKKKKKKGTKITFFQLLSCSISSAKQSQPNQSFQNFFFCLFDYLMLSNPHWASLMAQTVKRLSAMLKTQVQSLDQEDPLEKEMATHFSILAWKIPWTEKPGRLKSMGLQSLNTSTILNNMNQKDKSF